MLQQLGLLLAALAHLGKSLLRAAAHGNRELRADEHRDFTGVEFAVRLLDHVQDDEEHRAVFVDLRPLMALLRVFDRQRVEIELFGHDLELAGLRVLDRHPHEAIGPRQVVADFTDRDVREFLPSLVRDAVDQHQFAARMIA